MEKSCTNLQKNLLISEIYAIILYIKKKGAEKEGVSSL